MLSQHISTTKSLNHFEKSNYLNFMKIYLRLNRDCFGSPVVYDDTHNSFFCKYCVTQITLWLLINVMEISNNLFVVFITVVYTQQT